MVSVSLFSFLVGKPVSRVSNFRDCTDRQVPKTGDKGRLHGILCLPGLVVRYPNMVSGGEGIDGAPQLSAKDGMESAACFMKRQGDECRNRLRTSTKDIAAVVHSLKWKRGGHVARRDRRRKAQATSVWDVRVRTHQQSRVESSQVCASFTGFLVPFGQ